MSDPVLLYIKNMTVCQLYIYKNRQNPRFQSERAVNGSFGSANGAQTL